MGEYALAGNRGWRLGLDETALRYGITGKSNFISKLMKAGVCPSTMPKGALSSYNLQDLEVTHNVFRLQRVLLERNGLLPVFMCRNLLVPVLADIESNGMQLDEQRVKETATTVLRDYEQASAAVNKLTSDINFRSGPQLRSYIYTTLGFKELERRGQPLRTPKGNPKADGDTIAALSASTPEQAQFKKAWEKLSEVKQLEAVIKKLMGAVEEDGGHLFASINQGITDTHRFSSTGGKWKVQFHNFPGAFKHLFRARSDDFLICEADAPQLEFRVACDVGNDQTAKNDILRGVDVHRLTQDVIGVSRHEAKPFTFKPLYGGDSGTPRERAYYKAFREKYASIYETQTGWTLKVLRDKQLTIPSGLIFYWPDTRLQQSGYITNKASIFNYPIQSFATADIIPLVLWLVWLKLGTMMTKIVNTIHDSIIAEVHKDEVEVYKQILIKAFTEEIYQVLQQLYGYNFTTPLGVGINISKFWGEGTEEKYEPKPVSNVDKTIL